MSRLSDTTFPNPFFLVVKMRCITSMGIKIFTIDVAGQCGWCDHWPSPDHHQVSSDKMQSDRSRNLEEILLFCVCEWSEEESKCHQDAGECSLSLRHIRNVRNILHIRSSLFSRGEEENCEVFFLSQSLNITQHKFCAAPEVRQAPLKQFCWQRNIICDANFHPGLKRNVISGLSPLPACWTLWHVMF